MLLANTIEVLISKAFCSSCTNHDEFILDNNVSKEYKEMNAVEYTV